MRDFKANYGEMRNAAADITKAAGEYKSNVAKLYHVVDQLGNVWKGTDMEQYTTTVNGYKHDMTNLGVAVEGYASFLRKAANGIQATQEEVRSMVGKL